MRKSSTAVWPAPVRGLIRNGALVGADPSAAEVMDNWFPTAQGARLRGGSTLFATVGDPVVRLMTYRSGSSESVFAATADSVYNITAVADPEVAPTADIASLTSGDWSFVQFATPAGQYLVMANGADSVRNFNGAAWSTPSITGVTSSALSFVWSHKRRLWFVEDGTLSAWYLPVNSISGAAAEFPLDGVFKLGGALLFGGTWSVDAGDGLDDMMLFVTTEGEVAVYQGTDPGTDYALSGVYRIGQPLNKHGWFRAGGDLCILTKDGIIPVSEALNKDVTALQASAITYPIEDLWQQAVANATTGTFPAIVWPTRTLFAVGVPASEATPVTLVANARTGAWARVTGWDTQCFAIFGDELLFGDSVGRIVKADDGGSDYYEGTQVSYTATLVPKFQDFGGMGDKFALHARVMWLSGAGYSVGLGCFANYEIGEYPDAPAVTEETGLKWGGGAKWGDGSKWGSAESASAGSDWQAVSGAGFSLSPVVRITHNRNSKPLYSIAAIQLRYEKGAGL